MGDKYKMTNDEFIELAKRNNALLDDEESQKYRKEPTQKNRKFQLRFDWLSGLHFVDTNSFSYKFGQSYDRFVGYVLMAVCLLFLACCFFTLYVILRSAIAGNNWGAFGSLIVGFLVYLAWTHGQTKIF
jgi:hypothetical protein